VAKITRATQKVFAGAVVPTSNVAQFGSLRADAPVYSDDPAVIQALAAFGTGWAAAVVNNNAPAIQDENGLWYLVTRQLAYLMQTGVPEWDAGTTYYIGSMAQDGTGAVYRSLIDGNLNNALSDYTKWVLVTPMPNVNAGYGSVPLGAVLATFPGLIGAYACAATTAADALGFVKCGGQTISDATSAMNGVVVPNINNSVFLMGATSSGTTGGANTLDLSHAHTYAHTHSTDSKLGAISLSVAGSVTMPAHTHNLNESGAATLGYDASGYGHVSFGPLTFSASSIMQTPGGVDIAFPGGAATCTAIKLFGTTAGIYSAPSVGFTSTGTTASQAHDHTTYTQSATTTSTVLSATQDIRPNYISAVYVMRIK
jgi:hypothetical protein